MRINRLATAVLAGLAMQSSLAVAGVQAAPADGDHPKIPAVLALRPTADASAYELLIYGDIGESWWGDSVTAQSVVQQLLDLDPAVATINVRINSYGGSVADGLAIYNALKRHSAAKHVTVDGVAMSSASLIAMVGNTVHMPATSILMIHAPWSGIYGNAADLRRYADVLDTFAEAMADAYMAKSGKSRADCLALLQDGQDHYYTGTQAVAEGFADAVIAVTEAEPDDQAKALGKGLLQRYAASFSRAPEGIAEMAIAAALRARVPAAAAPGSALNPRPAMAPAATTEDDDMRTQGNAAGPSNPNPAAGGGNPAPAAAPTPTPTTGAPAAGLTRDEILAADRQRRNDIAASFAPFLAREGGQDLVTLQQQCQDDHNCTPAAAGERLLAALGSQAEPLNGRPRIEPGAQDAQATYREGAALAMLNRYDPGTFAADERSREFRGFTLSDLARDCVERSGARARGMSRGEIAVRALHSTSDFPNILEQVITRTLRQGYEGTMRTFVPWCRRATLPDFKQVSRVQLGGAPSLKRVLEGAEYEQGTIGDGAEKYAVLKYGRLIAATWELIINDDLDALTRIPMMFGRSAADLESDLVYANLTANANMADGVPLFHATHGNLGTAGAISDTTLGEMQEKMLLQKGIEGRHIVVRPEFLIVPPRQLVSAQKAVALPITPSQTANANPFYQALTVIGEPRLQDASATNWYGAANPNAIDTIEYAYLEGHEGVFTETKAGFEVDGVMVKCRHVFGTKAIDWRGLFKNPFAG